MAVWIMMAGEVKEEVCLRGVKICFALCVGETIWGGKERKSLGLREESKIFQQLSTRN